MTHFLQAMQALGAGEPRRDGTAGWLVWEVDGQAVGRARMVPVLWWSPLDGRVAWAVDRPELEAAGLPQVPPPPGLSLPARVDERAAHALVAEAVAGVGLDLVVGLEHDDGELLSALLAPELLVEAPTNTALAGNEVIDLGPPEGLLLAVATWLQDGDAGSELASALRQRLLDLGDQADGAQALRRLFDLADGHGLTPQLLVPALLRLLHADPRPGALAVLADAIPDGDAGVLPRLQVAAALRDWARDPVAALAVQQAVAATAPDDLRVWIELSDSHRRAGDPDAALAALDRGAAADPDAHAPWVNRGMLMRALERWEEAAQAFEQALERIDAPVLWHALGHCLQVLGRDDEGAAALRRAVEGYGDDPESLFWRAAAWCRLGQTEAALADLGRAIAQEPRRAAEARREPDFQALRADPRFAALVGG